MGQDSFNIGSGRTAKKSTQRARDPLPNNSVEQRHLRNDVLRAQVPIGSPMPFTGDTPPDGWLLCDGSELDRTVFAELFAVVGTKFGASGGAVFNIPDLRGRVVRGSDEASGRDIAPRAASATGGAASGAGSKQESHLETHRHRGANKNPMRGNDDGNGVGGNGGSWVTGPDNMQIGVENTDFGGADETTVKNQAMKFIIRYI
jgi:hypothetical protein